MIRHSSVNVTSLIKQTTFVCFFYLISACTTSTFDQDGRLIVRNYGINQYKFDVHSPQFIDLRNARQIGFYGDGSVTIGYKDSGKNRVYFGCHVLIVTNAQTDHDNVIQLINSLSSHSRPCVGGQKITHNSAHLPNKSVESVQFGLSTVTLSPTFPPGTDIQAFSLESWGIEMGDVFGAGYRYTSLISSGEDCDLLLVTESHDDFQRYKLHLNFNQGKHLCLALKP